MAIVYSYPTATPELQDLLVGTEMAVQGGEDAPRTRTFTIGSIVGLVTPALNLKANITSQVFLGAPSLPTGTIGVTQSAGNNTTALATTSFVTTADNLKANLTGSTFTGTITAPTIIKTGGLSSQYLMADGLTSTTPTFAQVTTAGSTTSTTIGINKAYSLQALVITGDNAPNGLIQVIAESDGPCVKVDTNDGYGVLATSIYGIGISGTTEEGTGVYASAQNDDGLALLVNGSNKGISVVNGGINITGVGYDTGYQLTLSLDSAAKPSTGTWTVASDSRVKTNINPYTKGLETILAINPITYDYNGKAGFDPTIIGNIGIIAQDVLNIIPESINTYHAKLNEDDEEKTELYNFDSHALTFILINAIKQLNAEIELLKSK